MRAWTTAVAAIVLAGCQGLSGPVVQLENLTDIPVAVHVNGAWVGTYQAGARVAIPIGDGRPPFAIEVVSGSGARLASITLTDVEIQAEPGTTGVAQKATVPCGRINLWFGLHDPGPPPVAEPAPETGPCP